MRVFRVFLLLFSALSAWGETHGAEAGSLVTIRVSGVHSSTGSVLVSLCGDRAAGFPTSCFTHGGMSPAREGETEIRIARVPDGRYSVAAFHDENGDFRPQIPPEGYAYGNGSRWPPSFDAAAVQVNGNTEITLKMEYVGAASSRSGRVLPPGVSAAEVRTNGLHGTLFTREGVDQLPGVILVGGSEGGLDVISQMATSFAEEGFATLALAYWRAPGLPQTLENIPLEYFDRAVDWLRTHPRVASSGIGMLGWSRGSEAALLMAVRNRHIAAVVGVAPSSVVWPGLNFRDDVAPKPAWTVLGQPLTAVFLDTSHYVQSAPLADLFIRSFPELDRSPEAAIPVERIQGGVMLISGGEDRIWPSVRFADRIGARLQSSGFRHDYIHLSYPSAGHAVFVGKPGSPMALGLAGSESYLGGTKEANLAARTESWPQVVTFLRKQLKVEQK